MVNIMYPPPDDTFSKISYSSLELDFEPVLEGIGQPTTVQVSGDSNDDGGFIWTEKTGVINHTNIDGGTEAIADYTDDIIIESWEQGLLSVAMVPDTHDLIVYYTAPIDNPNLASIATLEYLSLDDEFNVQGSDQLLRIPQAHSNHNGGGLGFRGVNRAILSLGDDNTNGSFRHHPAHSLHNESWRSAQYDDLPYGKILEIDISNFTPVGNSLNLSDAEIFEATKMYNGTDVGVQILQDLDVRVLAKGLRNPWSIDVTQEGIFVGDVGWKVPGELNFLHYGAQTTNFGWDTEENRAPVCNDGEIAIRKELENNPLNYVNPIFYANVIMDELGRCSRVSALESPDREVTHAVAGYPRTESDRFIGQSIVVGAQTTDSLLSGNYLFGDLRGEDGPTFFTTPLPFSDERGHPQEIEIHKSNLGGNEHLLNIYRVPNDEIWVTTTDFSETGGAIYRLNSVNKI